MNLPPDFDPLNCMEPVVYGLTRASTLKQEDSPAVQEDRILSSARAMGIAEPYILHEDLGTSGRKTMFSQRKKGQWLLKYAKGGDTIIVSKLDRLGRKTIDILQTITTLTERKIRIIVLNVHGSVLDMSSPFGKFAVCVMAGVAELEGDIISQRTSEGLQWMASQKLRISRSPGVGRMFVPVEGKLTRTGNQRCRIVWDREQVKIMREIVKRKDYYGQSFKAIASALYREGYLDECGKRWGELIQIRHRSRGKVKKIKIDKEPGWMKIYRAYNLYKKKYKDKPQAEMEQLEEWEVAHYPSGEELSYSCKEFEGNGSPWQVVEENLDSATADSPGRGGGGADET
ncbi:MAG: recombinase family protein [Pseudomonadota bacterium]